MVHAHARTNKLVLACYTYLESDWFTLCCSVASDIDKIITQPMKAAICIDDNKMKRSEFRSWSGLKILFEQKLAELEKLSHRHSEMTSKEHLLASAAGNIRLAMERQLKYVDFYNQDEVAVSVSDQLSGAPLTNSGCESQFAELDNSVKKFGGTATVSTLSNKHVIRKNNFFESENWKVLTMEEKKSKFAWARTSSQAKKVALLQKDWIGKVNDSKFLALVGKETKKKKRNERSLLLLEKCKEHSGPVTMNTTDMLEKLREPQLLLEVRYLRSTIAPNIRERVKVDKKFRKLSMAELKSEILKVIKPESDVTSLDSLFLSLFPDCETENDNSENISEDAALISDNGTHPGLAGFWSGPL